MCLAIPMRVVELEGGAGIAEVEGVRREVSFALLGDVHVGDYVIIHSGFAIQKLDENEAEETLRLLRELAGNLENEGEVSR